jgi:hypothetical protein
MATKHRTLNPTALFRAFRPPTLQATRTHPTPVILSVDLPSQSEGKSESKDPCSAVILATLANFLTAHRLQRRRRSQKGLHSSPLSARAGLQKSPECQSPKPRIRVWLQPYRNYPQDSAASAAAPTRFRSHHSPPQESVPSKPALSAAEWIYVPIQKRRALAPR